MTCGAEKGPKLRKTPPIDLWHAASSCSQDSADVQRPAFLVAHSANMLNAADVGLCVECFCLAEPAFEDNDNSAGFPYSCHAGDLAVDRQGPFVIMS